MFIRKQLVSPCVQYCCCFFNQRFQKEVRDEMQYATSHIASHLAPRPPWTPRHRPVTVLSRMRLIIVLGMLTCCAATATARADVVCSPDPKILWKVRGRDPAPTRTSTSNLTITLALTILWKVRTSGCPNVPWQIAAASDPKVRGLLLGLGQG